MSAAGFGYASFPPAGTWIPTPMPPSQQPLQSPAPASSFNPFAQAFTPATSGQQWPHQQPRPRREWSPKRGKGKGQSGQQQDERVQPSRASGGIPDPSPEYLVHASLPPLLLPHPRQILVVIDLNGTLLFRPSRKNNPSHFVERPHAKKFLSYCIDTFHVAIWSSARPGNVRRMCAQLMSPEQHQRVVAIWGRDKFGLDSADFNRRVQCYKRLSALWSANEVAATHPRFEEGVRWSQADTVLIDDSLEKARSEPYNLVPIPEFMGDANEPGYILPQVHDYINELSRQADISTYIRMSPFQSRANFTLGAPAIANAAAPAA